jgi:predicted neutral ceramidase superfamily lipid hydrolase
MSTEPKKVSNGKAVLARLKNGERLVKSSYGGKAYFDNGDFASHLVMLNLSRNEQILMDAHGVFTLNPNPPKKD